ncbi:MAG: hypothetical protein ACE5Q3_17615 [Alphaproteobacteria bacterium]
MIFSRAFRACGQLGVATVIAAASPVHAGPLSNMDTVVAWVVSFDDLEPQVDGACTFSDRELWPLLHRMIEENGGPAVKTDQDGIFETAILRLYLEAVYDGTEPGGEVCVYSGRIEVEARVPKDSARDDAAGFHTVRLYRSRTVLGVAAPDKVLATKVFGTATRFGPSKELNDEVRALMASLVEDFVNRWRADNR